MARGSGSRRAPLVTAGTILVVCTANICRSPVAAALLGHELGELGISVTSAGTHALVGSSPAPESVDFVRMRSGAELEWHGVQLTKAAAEVPDLILTMTEEQRSWIARLAPRTVRRTFTLLEFARVVDLLDDDAAFASLTDLVRACVPLRQRANLDGAPHDVSDPYGGPAEGYATSFAGIDSASQSVAHEISRHVARA